MRSDEEQQQITIVVVVSTRNGSAQKEALFDVINRASGVWEERAVNLS